ncbi:MAG: sugar ABC transporter permease [Clostridiales bacterium]|jgi:multiple sugar transport system permease protein|nr:sugar ABC transporter permease [Clostridiales bacterium]
MNSATQARKGLSRKAKENLIAYSFIAPNFIGFSLFTLVPLIFALVLSVLSWDGSNPIEFVGFDNFVRMFKDKTFWQALQNTLLYTAGVVPMTMAAALGLALLLNQKLRGRNFFRTVAFFPYVASLVAVAAVWSFLFSPTRGPVNQVLHMITNLPVSKLPGWATDKNWAIPTVIFFSIWKTMGYYMVIYLAGLQNVNPELYESASLDGAGAINRFRYITIPQLAPTTFFVLMILIINSFKVYDIFITIFAGADNVLSGTTRVLVYQIYNAAFRSLNYGYASAIALVLFLIVLIITIIQFKGEKKFGE